MDLQSRWLRTAKFMLLAGLTCLAITRSGLPGGAAVLRTPERLQQSSLVVTAMFPTSGAKNVCPDTPFRLTFASPPIAGTGNIQIVDASNDTVVESIDVSVPIRTKSIGGLPNYNYYPIIISGRTASLYLSHALAYGRIYYIKISSGAFKDATANPFTGFLDSNAWRFTTRTKPPVAAAKKITVAADGHGDFATVQGAIDFIPEGNTAPTTIFIRKGIYQEIIFFTSKNNLTIIAYANNDRINNNSGGNPFAPGAPAPGAAPVRNGAIYRRGLLLAHRVNDLTIAHLTLHNTTPQGGSQAEAIILNGTPTAHAIITDVDLYSFQDTLQINGQAYISNCYIEGDVDFMWGTGPCFFKNVHARALRSGAYYTQIRNPPANHGFVYQDCVFDGAPGVTGNFLSRIAPSRFPASEVVLINCTLTEAVGSVGWKLDAAAGAKPGDPIAAPNVHYWEYNSHDLGGRPVDSSQRLNIARELKLPDDKQTIANYSDPKFVLGGEWTPAAQQLR